MLEKKLGRPIKRTDITQSKVGFSSIVINRIWGSLSNCKKELGLMEQTFSHSKDFSIYKNALDKTIDEFKNNYNRTFITWDDIENHTNIEHRTFLKAFNNKNIDLFTYIKSKGLMMNPSNFSLHYTFDDGERVLSVKEYDFSNYLKSLGLKYNVDYFRDIKYKDFCNLNYKTKINCDYKIGNKYIEIAGMITENWETCEYHSTIEQNYKNKLIYKKSLLDENNIDYLFLYPEDFKNNNYKQKLLDFLDTDVSFFIVRKENICLE